MWPSSYTGLKIIQDQKIKDALELYRSSVKSETQKQGLLQTLGAFLARFANFSARKPKASFPGCDQATEDMEALVVLCQSSSRPLLMPDDPD